MGYRKPGRVSLPMTQQLTPKTPFDRMDVGRRFNYYRRIFTAYLGPRKSHLTFWHEVPKSNDRVEPGRLGEYYMPFEAKADYSGAYDTAGIPLLDYHGVLGLQYNPIAIAQYGLGNYNLYCQTTSAERRNKFLCAADWLVENLEQNVFGLSVWNHHFDWDYRTRLKAPWYSALAQGQGISLLLRAHRVTGHAVYAETAARAFEPFQKSMDAGGVVYVDDRDDVWLEEYIVFPPTHILNGFIWAVWGIYDYLLATSDKTAGVLFEKSIETLKAHLGDYDTGFWSLYEQSGTRLKMLASSFYHRLHIVQLEVLYRLTGEPIFREYEMRWEAYRRSQWKRIRAATGKVLFKLCHY